ncbi:MAG: thioesterase family protein [Planctomycetota bacterium]
MVAAPFLHHLRVRYCETDRMGVAHHGSYVAWFEEARTEWLRARGKTYREMEDEGVLLQVVGLQVEYRRSVTYDDEVTVSVREAERGPASITLAYEVRRPEGAAVVATGTTKLACVGRDGKIRRLPDEL